MTSSRVYANQQPDASFPPKTAFTQRRTPECVSSFDLPARLGKVYSTRVQIYNPMTHPWDESRSIYRLVYHKHQQNVGKYTSPMDGMGTYSWNYDISMRLVTAPL